jgi:hypothetical protein
MAAELIQNGKYLNLDLKNVDAGDVIDFTLKFDKPRTGVKETEGKSWTWRSYAVKLHSLNGKIVDKECSFFAKFKSNVFGKDLGEYLADFKAGDRFKATMTFKKGTKQNAKGVIPILQIWEVEQLGGATYSSQPTASPPNAAASAPPSNEQEIIAKLIELSTDKMTGEARVATYEQVEKTLKTQAGINDVFILKRLYEQYVAAMG